ncbi:MAG TPA: hypothetical protein PLT23_10370, partial [Lentisphaeria bacterium]|nr:hypothetical protein [Lentisphaeria bacterium]
MARSTAPYAIRISLLRLPRKPRAIFKTFLRRLRDETALVVLDIFSYLQDFPALALRPGPIHASDSVCFLIRRL